ncbi:hypothetical protein ACSFA0_26100 [Variovorax sp. LT1P1]|uniref:hypothetical protein n=1 Tax=Variovorax sp. LT1P1 TaxID=3443730 RepID=UPI003F47094E
MDGPAWLFVTAICWLMSMVFGWTSVMQLKAVADDGRSGLRTPFMTFLAACLMASSPSFLESLAVTTYGSDVWGKEVLSYVVDKDGSNKAFGAVLSMVSFIGYCFFVRGIWILKEAGEPQRPHGASVGKAIVVLLAGMAAIYIHVTLKMFATTFGWDISAFITG